MSELEAFVESHLNLQVKISYSEHHAFLLRHGLKACAAVLDVGTGNGAFAARLAQDHPAIQFVGIDKRAPCIESCQKYVSHNFSAEKVDMFSRESTFDFSRFDGFLLRYFLLHVDNAQKILELFKAKAKSGARFWIIDLDWSTFSCEPPSESFDKLTSLVREFCAKVSVESNGGQNVLPLIEKLGFTNIVTEQGPFTSKNIALEDLALYLKQEAQCYSRMSGQGASDSEIMRFIDEEVRTGKNQISYGMKLISCQLP